MVLSEGLCSSYLQKLRGGLENGKGWKKEQLGVKTKEACPGAAGVQVMNTWAPSWRVGFPAVAAKGTHPNLGCFTLSTMGSSHIHSRKHFPGTKSKEESTAWALVPGPSSGPGEPCFPSSRKCLPADGVWIPGLCRAGHSIKLL